MSPGGLVLVVVISFVFLSGSSSSGAAERTDFSGDIEASGERVENYERDLLELIDEVSASGGRLEELQSDLDATEGRVAELDARSQELSERLRVREAEREAAEARQREALVEAYRDGGLRGIDVVLEDLIGGDIGGLDPSVRQLLFAGREEIEEYREAERIAAETLDQVEDIREEQRAAMEEQRQRRGSLAAGIRSSEAAQEELRLEISEESREVREIRGEQRDYGRRMAAERRREVEEMQESLRRKERARIDAEAAATGGESSRREEEISFSEEELGVSEVEPIPYSSYMQLYRDSAERYGFGEDWYILAAIGKVESDHGVNLGPSSAGAMGPMQFLPSTWANSGVDGNGDGEANIMDPEDAIPAAAGYLVAGGAPEDWYSAIYSYNHADWYVQKVLAVADGYEQLDAEGNLN